MADRPIVPARITMALDARGLYGPDVDTACGAAEPDVDEWELGISVPSDEQVRLLAELTHLPVAFFYEPYDPAPGFICFRDKRGCVPTDGVMVPPAAQGKPAPRQGALW